jgi:L-aminopeptidase/D-esterase-like protein
MPITDVPGIAVGHWTEAAARTGCTVVLTGEHGAVAAVDVRGSAPGSRELDIIRPGKAGERVHAVCLTGGSAFGLAAADGVMRWLREHDIGVAVAGFRVPIVPAAVVFDLPRGAEPPGPDAGYAACEAAERDRPPAQGRVGAGAGTTIGKLLDPTRTRPGGVGTAAIRLPDGATVGALAVVNAVGDVVDERGLVVAGGGEIGAPPDVDRMLRAEPVEAGNTTLGVIATDAALTKNECLKLAELGHDALALAIRPVHTVRDGDMVFALGTGSLPADPIRLGIAATEALRRAIVRAVVPQRG